MSRFERHIFVCENERAPDNPKGSCAAKGALEVRLTIKKLMDQHGLKGRMRCNTAGCLDACAFGVAVVIYPESVWYTVANVQEAEELFHEHVLGGRVVERLRMKLPVKKDPA